MDAKQNKEQENRQEKEFSGMKLSVIIPVYNEEKTLSEIIKRIDRVKLEKELIIVDDGSTDRTKEILKQLIALGRTDLKVVFHAENQGKGAAIRTGIKEVSGQAVIIQDADLEYDPNDYLELIKPIIKGESQVVYGSRNLGANKRGGAVYYWGGVFLSWLANRLYGIKITDEPTCYKVFSTEIIKGLNLKSRRFEFCPEVTAKLAKQKQKIVEVPISYNPRSKAGGKKLNWRDGFSAVWTLIKYRFTD